MAEELGKIEKPSVEEFKGKRTLFFVPLIFSPLEPEADLLEKIERYWSQVEAHISNLEQKLGKVTKIYHELIPAKSEEGVTAIEELNKESHRIVKARLDKGAELLSIEDRDLLTEFMDWGKCLASGLQNERVFEKVYQSYKEAQSKRNEYIAKRIDETLKT